MTISLLESEECPFSNQFKMFSVIFERENTLPYSLNACLFNSAEFTFQFQGGKTLANKSKRFTEQVVENPGPGAYNVERYTEFRQTKSAPQMQEKNKSMGVSRVHGGENEYFTSLTFTYFIRFTETECEMNI